MRKICERYNDQNFFKINENIQITIPRSTVQRTSINIFIYTPQNTPTKIIFGLLKIEDKEKTLEGAGGKQIRDTLHILKEREELQKTTHQKLCKLQENGE